MSSDPLQMDFARNQSSNREEACEGPPIRYVTEIMGEIPPDQDYIYLVGTSGYKVTVIDNDLLLKYPHITQLVLRSHVITQMRGLQLPINTPSKLTELELYDNAISKLENLEDVCLTLLNLDMSYNVLRDMSHVSLCVNLTELYLANNKLKEVRGLSTLTQLKKVDLGANRIRKLPEHEFSTLQNLEELWIGKNKIEKIEGLSNLTKLKRLDLQSNRITVIENLDAQQDTLEELYLSHNGITDDGLDGLQGHFTKLSTLDIQRNKLTDLSKLAHIVSLDELWLSGNNIESFCGVEPLSSLTNLDCIYLEYNPLDQDFEYRIKLKQIIPSLTQIDAVVIGYESSQQHASLVCNNVKSVMKQSSSYSQNTPKELQQNVFELAHQQKQQEYENGVLDNCDASDE